jgi:hypothetical protein
LHADARRCVGECDLRIFFEHVHAYLCNAFQGFANTSPLASITMVCKISARRRATPSARVHTLCVIRGSRQTRTHSTIKLYLRPKNMMSLYTQL